MNVIRCWLGYWLHVWPALVRSTFVGFDRYYHDVLVDPRRYRYGGPRWFARLTCAWVPKPDLWILLDAPASVIRARKNEIPLAEIERQRLLYRELVAHLPGGHIVDASRSPDEVAHAVARIIIDFLAARTARRSCTGVAVNVDGHGIFAPDTPLLALPSWRAPRLLLPKSGGPIRRWRDSAFYPATRSMAQGLPARLARQGSTRMGRGAPGRG